MAKAKKWLSLLLLLVMVITCAAGLLTGIAPRITAHANAAVDSPEDDSIDYMRIKNHTGPSGVALGALGGGYYEIDPYGRVSRTCVNNIHKEFINYPNGMIVAARDENNAVRLQRGDNSSSYSISGYADSYYTGLWPRVELEFEGGDAGNRLGSQAFSAYSGVVAQDVQKSSLTAVYYTVELSNHDAQAKEMSAMVSWGDIIGRGIRDTNKKYDNGNGGLNLAGDGSDWYFMDSPQTYAEGVTVEAGGVTYKGVKQYTESKILPKKVTFQNYNDSFMLLAEEGADAQVSILKNFNVSESNPFSAFVNNGAFSDDDGKVALSAPMSSASAPTNGSAVAVTTSVEANSTKQVKFLIAWYMPAFTEQEVSAMDHFENCDYNKYYTTYADNIEELAQYAISVRDEVYDGIMEWQQPILDSSMPDWLKFKEINSGYTLYTNGVLNSRKNFSTLEGEMGGYGGTMDQKMSSHPFYEKLFPELNRNENMQFANVTGADGEIQHFDLHYYHGISSFDPADSAYNPTPAGSMLDNSGAWMVQMYNDYLQTGSDEYLRMYADVMETSMAFIQSKCPEGTNIPNYNTTYDDYSHPEILIFSGTVYLNMLEIAENWSALLGDSAAAQAYAAQYEKTYADVQKLYIEDNDIGGSAKSYYSFGSTADYISSGGTSGTIEETTMFSGAMAGQFISRYSGLGDVVPFDRFVEHMKTFITTSVQGANDYYAAKVYNMRTQQALDNAGSRCWPFYLDSYGGMAAIQAGYVEDGLEILQHTQLVNFRNGWTWSQNLWNPSYSTYMTAPVVWFLNDVLAGSSIDVPGKTLTFGPTCIASEGIGTSDSLEITLYYPKYWATLHYDKATGEMTYEIIKTFYEEGEAPIVFDTVRAQPAGVATDEAEEFSIPAFSVQEGAVLDLSAHIDAFEGNTLEKNLQPVNKYDASNTEKIADGTGLRADYYDTVDWENAQPVFTETETMLEHRYDADTPPYEGAGEEYTIVYTGSLMPRYSQKYNLIFETIHGDLTVILDGQTYTGSDFTDVVESEQFTPWTDDGVQLQVIEKELTAGKLHPVTIIYEHAAGEETGGMRVQWWSTTQTLGTIITERMYPPTEAQEWMDAIDYADKSGNVQPEGDHLGYVEKNNWVRYTAVDFGNDGYQLGSFIVEAAAPASSDSSGGTLEVYLDEMSGDPVAVLQIEPTGSWTDWKLFEQEFTLDEPVTGLHDVYLYFRPDSNYLCNILRFRFGVSYAPEDHPTKITFATAEETVYYSDGTYKNEITIDKGELDAVRYTLTDLDGNNTGIAAVAEDGTVTFYGVGDVRVTASSLHTEASYILHIDERETLRYISDFTQDADGWTIGNGGKEYDRSEVKDGRIELEGSDLGISDQSANSWMYKIFRLRGDCSYELIIGYNTPDSGAATMMRVYVEKDGVRTVLRDWTRIVNTSEMQSVRFDLSEYSGSVITIGIEQNDKGTGSGEILCIQEVGVIGTENGGEPSPDETFTLSGTTLGGARVELRGADGSVIEAVVATENGSFSFADLAAGEYTLAVRAEGYAETTVHVTLDGDKAVGEIALTEGEAPEGGTPNYGLIFGCIGGALAVAAVIAVLLVLRAKKKKNSDKGE